MILLHLRKWSLALLLILFSIAIQSPVLATEITWGFNAIVTDSTWSGAAKDDPVVGLIYYNTETPPTDPVNWPGHYQNEPGGLDVLVGGKWWRTVNTTGSDVEIDVRDSNYYVWDSFGISVFDSVYQWLYIVDSSAPMNLINGNELPLALDISLADSATGGLGYDGWRVSYEIKSIVPIVADPPTTVPEPATFALLAAGLFGLMSVKLMRDKKKG